MTDRTHPSVQTVAMRSHARQFSCSVLERRAGNGGFVSLFAILLLLDFPSEIQGTR